MSADQTLAAAGVNPEAIPEAVRIATHSDNAAVSGVQGERLQRHILTE